MPVRVEGERILIRNLSVDVVADQIFCRTAPRQSQGGGSLVGDAEVAYGGILAGLPGEVKSVAVTVNVAAYAGINIPITVPIRMIFHMAGASIRTAVSAMLNRSPATAPA